MRTYDSNTNTVVVKLTSSILQEIREGNVTTAEDQLADDANHGLSESLNVLQKINPTRAAEIVAQREQQKNSKLCAHFCISSVTSIASASF